jgi:hypothetical protein
VQVVEDAASAAGDPAAARGNGGRKYPKLAGQAIEVGQASGAGCSGARPLGGDLRRARRAVVGVVRADNEPCAQWRAQWARAPPALGRTYARMARTGTRRNAGAIERAQA